MIKTLFFIAVSFGIQQARSQQQQVSFTDSVQWMQLASDSGVIHAAIATPGGKGPFPAIVILHGTHGFAKEYVALARRVAQNGFIGIAVCWFAGRKGAGEKYITPIDFSDAPPFVDVEGPGRFRIANYTIDILLQKLGSLPNVQQDRLALFGHSRGAGAALNYVMNRPGNVQAIILNSSGYPAYVTSRAELVKIPVLILHGTADNPSDGGSPVTDIAMARQFEVALETVKNDVQVKYYEGAGHNSLFSDPAQLDDTVQRISRFLKNKFPDR
jgi:alpha-beta hydrolase superfamily lysophospholipase